MQKKTHKLGVIVPYRGRYSQLLSFKDSISKYLTDVSINFELIVVEQDGAKTFNRGKLLNIGFKIAKKLKCDYVVFHDVDMLPVNVDYSYTDKPIHLATNFTSKENMSRIVFDEYFGGVTLFPIDTFEEINGYSNEYWGWGYEDDDLLYRCKLFGILLDSKDIKMMGGNVASLRFNGFDSHIQFKNVVEPSKPTTFFVSFHPDDIICDHEGYDDSYSVFTILEHKLRVSYNSYNRYGIEVYDSNGDVIYVNSKIKTNYQTNICVTIDPSIKEIGMFQDGKLIEKKKYETEILPIRRNKDAYLGVTNPKDKKSPNYFRGTISSFAIFSNILNADEIREISNNQFFGLTQNFGEYVSSEKLKLYYDPKFIKGYKLIDLSGNGNDGNIIKCEIVGNTLDATKTIQIPFRRESMFELLYHEENGYVDGAWKDITTRYNQLRYHNEVAKGYRNTKDDGLSNCTYKELSNTTIENETHLVVSI